jgi:hypothetical protein
MNARNRIYLIFFLAIGIIFLIIAIVQSQILWYEQISSFTDFVIKDFLGAYVSGFPNPITG